MTSLKIGDVIRDTYDHEGIVFAAERRPSKQWLAAQDDARVSNATGPWWNVLPLEGGAIVVPDEVGVFVRRATIDDLLVLFKAQQNQNAGHATLNELLSNLSKARKNE